MKITMAQTAQATSVEEQIADYVSGLSTKYKDAVLTIVKAIAEAEEEAEFEKKWANAVPVEEAFKHVHDFIRTLQWKK